MEPQSILRFWFEECTPAQWWAVDTAFDAQIRERFLPTLRAAAQAELHAWRATPEGRLAESSCSTSSRATSFAARRRPLRRT